jgi:DNA-binding HxlR family transcriptional regulator
MGYCWKEGTFLIHTHQMESVMRPAPDTPYLKDVDPRLNALVMDLIGRVADKWTMTVLEVLADAGTLRFTRLAEAVPGVSQKMLTQTLRQMERDGLVLRKVYPVVPPHVDYTLTEAGLSLGAAFCGVWTWAEEHLERIAAARTAFDAR